MKEHKEAQALIEMAEAEREAEISNQLNKLKTSPFTTLINILCILVFTYFYLFFLPPTKNDPNFGYIAMFVIGVVGIASSEAYRANRRIDLIVKLLKVKYDE